MGLRDYEFDVAPELLAAVARGRPGPLMDAAMSHMGNVAQAARDAAQRELNERRRRMVEAEEASIAASLEEVSTNVGNGVNRSGLFSTDRVGGTAVGVNRMGSDFGNPTSVSGPGGDKRIPVGNKGLYVKGVGVQDFIQGLILGRRGYSLADDKITRLIHDLQQTLLLLIAEYTDAANNRERARAAAVREESEAVNPPPSTAPSSESNISSWRLTERKHSQEMHDSAHRQAATSLEIERLRRLRRDTPDAPDQSTAASTSVDAMILWQFLQSLGGLGFSERGRSGTAVGSRPAIFNAVDPNPLEDNLYSLEIRDVWQSWLVDPIVER